MRSAGLAAAALSLTATGVVVAPGLASGDTLADGRRALATVVGAAQLDNTAKPQVRGTDTETDATADIKGTHTGAGASEARSGADRADGGPRVVEQTAAQAKKSQQEADRLAERRSVAQARASRETQRAKLLQRQRAALAAAHAWVLPARTYTFTSPFGRRWGRLHAGNDFAAPIGTPLRSLSGGTVIAAGQDAGYGNKVEIRFWDGTVAWYAHMSRIDVEVGDQLAPDQRVGTVGNTGHSTGPHLHLEIRPGGGRPVDPRAWLAKRGVNV